MRTQCLPSEPAREKTTNDLAGWLLSAECVAIQTAGRPRFAVASLLPPIRHARDRPKIPLRDCVASAFCLRQEHLTRSSVNRMSKCSRRTRWLTQIETRVLTERKRLMKTDLVRFLTDRHNTGFGHWLRRFSPALSSCKFVKRPTQGALEFSAKLLS